MDGKTGFEPVPRVNRSGIGDSVNQKFPGIEAEIRIKIKKDHCISFINAFAHLNMIRGSYITSRLIWEIS
jgi:hypothetical protein